jgi:hypothetical protein
MQEGVVGTAKVAAAAGRAAGAEAMAAGGAGAGEGAAGAARAGAGRAAAAARARARAVLRVVEAMVAMEATAVEEESVAGVLVKAVAEREGPRVVAAGLAAPVERRAVQVASWEGVEGAAMRRCAPR